MRRIVTTAVAVALMGGAALVRARRRRRRPDPTERPCPAPPASCRRTTCSSSTPRGGAARVRRADRRRHPRHRAPGPERQRAAARPVRHPRAARPVAEEVRAARQRPQARQLPPGPPDRRRGRRPGLRLHRARGRADLQHPALPPLRRHRHRRPADARVARAEPRGDGLRVEQHRRPARLPRAADRRRPRRQPALRRLPQGPRRRHLRLLRRREAGQEAHRLRLLRARQRLRGRPVPRHGHPDGQPHRDRRPRVLPRRAVRLRLRRGPVDDGGDRDLDGGAHRHPGQRQPPVLPLEPDLRALRAARRVQQQGRLPVRQLGLLGVPVDQLRHRHRQEGVGRGRLAQAGRREVQHHRPAEGPEEEGRPHQGLRQVRRGQPHAGRELPRGRGVPVPQGPRRQAAQQGQAHEAVRRPRSTTSPPRPTSTPRARACRARSGSCR